MQVALQEPWFIEGDHQRLVRTAEDGDFSATSIGMAVPSAGEQNWSVAAIKTRPCCESMMKH